MFPLYDTVRSRTFPLINLTLILANVLAILHELKMDPAILREFIFTIVEIPAVLFLIFWFLSQLYSGWFVIQGGGGSGIAWWAHVGGFAFGVIMVFLFRRQVPYRIDTRRDYGP